MVPAGTRYLPLKGDQRRVEIEGRALPPWQWEIDNNARVKVAVAHEHVVVVAVSLGHPKENE